MTGRPGSIGCLAVLIGVTMLLITPLAISFAIGPYSSARQAWSYRGGSLAFLIGGVIAPSAAIALGADRSPLATRSLAVWLLLVLLLWAGWALLLGGGI